MKHVRSMRSGQRGAIHSATTAFAVVAALLLGAAIATLARSEATSEPEGTTQITRAVR